MDTSEVKSALSLRHGVITLQAVSEANRRLWMEAMDGKEPVGSVHLLTLTQLTSAATCALSLQCPITNCLSLQIYTLPSLLSKKEESKC